MREEKKILPTGRRGLKKVPGGINEPELSKCMRGTSILLLSLISGGREFIVIRLYLVRDDGYLTVLYINKFSIVLSLNKLV